MGPSTSDTQSLGGFGDGVDGGLLGDHKLSIADTQYAWKTIDKDRKDMLVLELE